MLIQVAANFAMFTKTATVSPTWQRLFANRLGRRVCDALLMQTLRRWPLEFTKFEPGEFMQISPFCVFVHYDFDHRTCHH